ncbi:MerR family transcriptional regulator [Parablautia muri]|uniref:Uncharacterized protein n=1 Tax=Parablautia muri TaxID=2320879 RepID=A0A9X5GTL5_9FIRM|nr:hypothetical protein [Parablautia muri]NBJ93132.1 hypothetical protein [Parablautia muri]
MKKALSEKIRKLKECVDAVDYKVWYYEKAKQAGTLSVHNTMKKEDIPPRMQTIRSRMSHVTRLKEE